MGDWSRVQLPVPENLSQYITSHQGQLSLAIPLWVDAINTSQRVVMLCSWGVKAGMVREWVASKTVWSPCYHGPYLSALAMGSSHNRALHKCPITLLLPKFKSKSRDLDRGRFGLFLFSFTYSQSACKFDVYICSLSSNNRGSKILQWVTWHMPHPFLTKFCIFCSRCFMSDLHTKNEVCSYILSRDILRVPKSEK